MFSVVGTIGLVVAVIALKRVRALAPLRDRIDGLERDVAALRRALAERSSPTPDPVSLTASLPETPVSEPASSTAAGPTPPPGSLQSDTTSADTTSAAGTSTAAPFASDPPRPPPPRPSAPPSDRGGPSPPQFRLPEVDWERWIGVRGAAVLGGIVLALAGVYFFRYSIAHGLIPPWLRVVIGTSLGLACIAGAELRARKSYEAAANALVGGGIVMLYAAFWASRSLYDLIDTPVAMVLMVSVTGACTALAHRHASLVIAMIGLIGGFATPALLSSGEDRPIALFAYILLLDACLLFVARARGWPILALLSLAGTLGYQAVWIGDRMGSDQVMIAIGVLVVFALAYAWALRSLPAEGRRQWLVTQAGAALLPFVFALYLASQGKLEEHIFPIGILLVLLSASASWIGRSQNRPWIGLGAAAASSGVFAVEIFGRSLHTILAWEAAAVAVLLAAVFHVFVELDRERADRNGPAPAALLACGSLFVWLTGAAFSASHTPVWSWLAGWMGLVGLALRHAGCPRRGAVAPAAAASLAIGWTLARVARSGGFLAVEYVTDAGITLCLAAFFLVVALMRAEPATQRFGQRAAALFALVAILPLSIANGAHEAGPLLGLGSLSLLGVLAMLAATRMPSGAWGLAATLVTAFSHLIWTVLHPNLPGGAIPGTALAVQAATALVFAFWPFAAFHWLRADRFAWYGAALAGPAWFLSLRELYGAVLGDATIGLLAVGLGAVALGGAVLATRLRGADDPVRKSNLAWFLSVALGFGTVAIPLQLEKEWITLGWALEGLAAIWLWKRLDHAGVKYFAFALFAGVTLRLVANEAVLGYYPRPGVRIVNWLFYTYLVPAAAMFGAMRLLQPIEVERARAFEERIYRFGHPALANTIGLAAIGVVFVWINLAISDWYATGADLRISFERMPARDLTTSIAWALYALALLTAGVRARSRGLRWLSLGLILTSTLKVFLHDLGELEDLYRVASLLGLAVALIAISLAYQRFVVPAGAEEEA